MDVSRVSLKPGVWMLAESLCGGKPSSRSGETLTNAVHGDDGSSRVDGV